MDSLYALTSGWRTTWKYGMSLPNAEVDVARCPTCGSDLTNYNETVKCVIGGGRLYPDIFNFDPCCTYLVFSDKAVDSFLQAGITGIKIREELPLYENGGEPISKDTVRYFIADVTGLIHLDLKAMHLKFKETCPDCHRTEPNRERIGDAFFDFNSWSGDDICHVSHYPSKFVCTQRVLDVIYKCKLKGFSLRYGIDLFRIRELDLKAHQKMLTSNMGYTPCYLKK